MKQPSETVVIAWVRLVRAQRGLVAKIEADLKTAGLPSLFWYDVLLELKQAQNGQLAPGDLERRLLFEQYNLSRLLDRMERAGFLRRVPYPGDKRRQLIEITPEGRALQRKIWSVYGSAIARYVGSKLNDGEAEHLAVLLQKLIHD